MAEIVDRRRRYRVLLHRHSRAAFAMEINRNTGSEIPPGSYFREQDKAKASQ